MKTFPLAVFSSAIAAAALTVATPGNAQQRAAPPVDVAKPVAQNVIEWDEYTGRFEASEQADVRARVSGFLDEIHFEDGQLVVAGQLLFVIDPRPFEAELARTQGQLAVAQAQLELAEKELARMETLRDSRAISQNDVDVRRANRLQAVAEVQAAEAVVRAARLELEFTQVTAPISGRISDRRVDVGNLISGGGAQSTLLTTIVKLDPIYFVFDASEADYLRYVRLSRRGERASSRQTDNPVEVKLMDEDDWTHKGKMNFVDNRLDPNSGTIRGRAVFANPDRFLTPGVFGRLRLIGSGEYPALLLPDAAVLSDQAQKIVMTVAEDGSVSAKPVTARPGHRRLEGDPLRA